MSNILSTKLPEPACENCKYCEGPGHWSETRLDDKGQMVAVQRDLPATCHRHAPGPHSFPVADSWCGDFRLKVLCKEPEPVATT